MILANKKIFLKNQILSRLFWSKNLAKAIPWVFRGKSSIFWALILIGLGFRSSLAAKAKIIALTSLLKLIKALILG